MLNTASVSLSFWAVSKAFCDIILAISPLDCALDFYFVLFFSIIGLFVGQLYFVHIYTLLQVILYLQGVYSVALGRTILVSGGEDSKVKKYLVNFSLGLFFSINGEYQKSLILLQFDNILSISRFVFGVDDLAKNYWFSPTTRILFGVLR